MLSLSFALLIGLLFPCVIIMADFDFGAHRAKYLVYMLWIYAASCLLMFSADVCLFYIIYELLIVSHYEIVVIHIVRKLSITISTYLSSF